MTKRDLLQSNDDLIKRAAGILARKPIYSLTVKASPWKDGFRTVVVRAGTTAKAPKRIQHISRLDIYVAGRPYKSFDARDGAIGSRTLTLKRHRGKNNLLVQAFDGANNLVAAYRHD